MVLSAKIDTADTRVKIVSGTLPLDDALDWVDGALLSFTLLESS